jgi:hypothetical protein
MKRLIKWLAILAVVTVAMVAIYMTLFPSATVRYRLALEAEADGTPVSVSGVREVSYSKQSQFAAQHELVIDVRGEALALDFGQRGTLFALLKGDTDDRSGAEWIVLRAFNFPGGGLPRPVEQGVSEVRRLSGKVDLPLTSLPVLVRFRDINDPMTVEKLDPLNLEKSFGPGVKLTRATLEIVPAGLWPFNWLGITGEPITDSVEQKLSWLKGTRGGYLDGKFAGGGPALSNALSGGDFKTGLYR